jgi:hypothetical protein
MKDFVRGTENRENRVETKHALTVEHVGTTHSSMGLEGVHAERGEAEHTCVPVGVIEMEKAIANIQVQCNMQRFLRKTSYRIAL